MTFYSYEYNLSIILLQKPCNYDDQTIGVFSNLVDDHSLKTAAIAIIIINNY